MNRWEATDKTVTAYLGMDHGPKPMAINIDNATICNKHYRSALWTGTYLQVTLMSLPVGGEIGLEMHPDVDQFIRVEYGFGLVEMGERKDNLSYRREVNGDYAFVIPAGTWHNLTNTANTPLKLYSIYAPPQHPHGTVHETKAIADAMEHGE